MLAIPVFRSRVAPVLDWCSKIRVFPEEGLGHEPSREIDGIKGSSFELMRLFREKGITTLICGVIAPETLAYGEHIGLKIIHGVAGEIDEILEAYRRQKLDAPQYRLPGCHGCHSHTRRARYAGNGTEGKSGANKPNCCGTGPGRRNTRRKSTKGKATDPDGP